MLSSSAWAARALWLGVVALRAGPGAVANNAEALKRPHVFFVLQVHLMC